MGLAVKNNNPGNLKDPSTGSFRTFNTPQDGYAALLNDLQAKQTGTTTTGLGPSSSLIDFASKYAPANDNNATGQYAANMANKMGVNPDAKLKDLDIGKWAAAVASNEDKDSLFGKQDSSGFNPHPFSGVGAIDFSGTNTDTQKTNEDNKPKDFLGSAGFDIKKALSDTGDAFTRASTGEINPVSGVIQGVGGLAKGATSVANDAITHLPIVGGAVQGVENWLGDRAKDLAGTSVGQSVAGSINSFAQAHPELAGNISSAADIAGVIPLFKGAGLLKDAAGNGVRKVLGGGTDAFYDAVAPNLGPKATAAAIAKNGTSKSGLLRTIGLNADPYVQKVANTVKENVPDFKPGELITDNIAKTQRAIDDSVRNLRAEVIASGKDKIFSPNELKGIIDSVEPPISIRGTPFETQIRPLKNAVMQLARKNGGKVSSLLDTRQEFDALVRKTYPNLYLAENSPMRDAITSIRDALTNYTAERLPTVALKNQLGTQSRLIRAVGYMSRNATVGKGKIIGTNMFERMASRNPKKTGLLRGAAKAAATGVGIRGTEGFIP